jgi:hypothetical protein
MLAHVLLVDRHSGRSVRHSGRSVRHSGRSETREIFEFVSLIKGCNRGFVLLCVHIVCVLFHESVKAKLWCAVLPQIVTLTAGPIIDWHQEWAV